MAAAVEHDEAGVGQLGAEDRPQRRRQQPVVRAPDDQGRRLDAVKSGRDVGAEEIAAGLPESDRADAKGVAGEEHEARRRAQDRAGERESERSTRLRREDPCRRDQGELCDQMRLLGGEGECDGAAHRVADDRRAVQSVLFLPLAQPGRGLVVAEAGQADDVHVVVRLEGGDRRPPPVRRGRNAVDEHHRRPGAHRKRSRSGGITSATALPSPSSWRPRTIAAGIPSALPITSSAAPAISSATASLSWSARAEASGSSGRRTTVSAPGAFEASTPAEAQTKPWRVSAMTSGGRLRTTRAVSRRITSTWRGSPSPACAWASSEGSTSLSATTRPSALDTVF